MLQIRWYQNSARCYAALSDVSTHSKTNKVMKEFRRSRWFSRGWTLQELLAPQTLRFCTKGWGELTQSVECDIQEEVPRITGIPAQFVDHRLSMPHASVAQKMSWAANRVTTRVEDMAYCLLGILGVNLPLLYGEGGERAFIRVQEEIIKKSTDQSIFAWEALPDLPVPRQTIFAPSPQFFRNGGGIIRLYPNLRDKRVYQITNQGLLMDAAVFKVLHPDEDSHYAETLLVLNCSPQGPLSTPPIALLLSGSRRVEDGKVEPGGHGIEGRRRAFSIIRHTPPKKQLKSSSASGSTDQPDKRLASESNGEPQTPQLVECRVSMEVAVRTQLRTVHPGIYDFLSRETIMISP
jgi:hypothetical protein